MSDREVACDLLLVDVGARVFVDDGSAFEHDDPVGDVDCETEQLLGCNDAQPALVADAFERARRVRE